ncbi:MAG: inositol monophosphatase family protein [Alphaproteobacteria bacterium]
MSYLPNTNVLFAIVRNVAKIYRRDFGELQNLQNSKSSKNEFVQKSKSRVESFIIDELESKYSKNDYKIITISNGSKNDFDATSIPKNSFIINALEGEMNFKRGIPLFCITIAHIKDNIIQNSIVYNPISDEVFIGERGISARHNNVRMEISSEENSNNAMVAIDASLNLYNNDIGDALLKYLNSVNSIRQMGAISLEICMVSNGALNCFIGDNESRHSVIASLLILEESGGKINTPHLTGERQKNYFIVSNQKIYDNLING